MTKTYDFNDLIQLVDTRRDSGVSSQLRIQFNETQLDVFVDVVNNVFGLSGQEAISRSDMVTLFYNDIFDFINDAQSQYILTALNHTSVPLLPEKETFIQDYCRDSNKNRSAYIGSVLQGSFVGFLTGWLVFFGGMSVLDSVSNGDIMPLVEAVFLPMLLLPTIGGGMKGFKNVWDIRKTVSDRAAQAYDEKAGLVNKALNRFNDLAHKYFEKTDMNDSKPAIQIKKLAGYKL